jgi:hypothetical protein
VVPTSGRTCDTEVLESQVIGEQEHIFDFVDDAPPTPTVGSRVSGPVVSDQANPEPPIDILVRPPFEPTARRSVKREDGEPVAVSPQGKGERAPVWGDDRAETLADSPRDHTASDRNSRVKRLQASRRRPPTLGLAAVEDAGSPQP